MKKIMLAMMLLMSGVIFAQEWKTNLTEAEQIAETENKNIILVFSGSDWCGPCIKLDQTVWQSDAFRIESAKEWILVKADFPKKKEHSLPAEIAQRNGQLAEKYNPEGYFPLVVVLDKNGRVLGKAGYNKMSPEEYIALLHAFEKKS